MTFKIAYSRLSKKAYNKIKAAILDGTLKPGEKIVQEKIAQKLGISRIPLIQALTMLEGERLIESSPRKTARVREITSIELLEIFEVRTIMEKLGVTKLAADLDKRRKEKLLKYAKDFETYFNQNDWTEYYSTDRKFHYFILESSRNNLLTHVNETFNIFLLSYNKGVLIDPKISIMHHQQLIKAIIERDPQRAQGIIEKHFLEVKKILNSVSNEKL